MESNPIKNLNVNFFQIGLDPLPPPIKILYFLRKKFKKNILLFLFSFYSKSIFRNLHIKRLMLITLLEKTYVDSSFVKKNPAYGRH